MSDLAVYKNFDVSPNVQVRKLWVEQQIAEKECRIKRLEADAEEIMRARLKSIQADILMLKREVSRLYEIRDTLDDYGNEDIIDMRTVETKKGV